MVSMPRHIWPDDQALVTRPLLISQSILRCPSILVTGSMVIRVDMVFPPLPPGGSVVCREKVQVFGAQLEAQDGEGDHADGQRPFHGRGEVIPARAGGE